jgi:antitoxin MazE
MKSKIAKWGNSAAVRLPADALRVAGFSVGENIEVTAQAGVVELKSRRRIPTIAELFAEAEKQGPLEPPESVDWGPDVGSEVIDDAYSRGEITLEDLLRPKDR